MPTTDCGNNHNYGIKFHSNTFLQIRLIHFLFDSNYIFQYIYLLILLVTEINCSKQLDVNTSMNNNNNHLMTSNQLSQSLNQYPVHNTLHANDDMLMPDNDPLSLTSSSSSTTTTLQLAFVVTEEVPIGTIVGNILSKLHLQNPNWLITNTLSHSNSNNNGNNKKSNQFINLKPIPYISLNQTTGDLLVRTRIDRESLCDTMGTCCHTDRQSDYQLWSNYKLDISNYDKLTGQLSLISPNCVLRMLVLLQLDKEQFIEIVIYVLDINDNPPRWVQSVIELEIPEHVSIGTSYQLPEAIDPDQGPMHTVIAYELQNKPVKEDTGPTSPNHSNRNVVTKQPFTLDVHALENSNSEMQKFSLRLRVEEDLDRETQSSYELILYAIDGGDTPGETHTKMSYTSNGNRPLSNTPNKHTGSVLIRVLLMDKNDNPPVFKNPHPVVIIPENTKPGAVIYQVSASDLDSADHDSLVYKIGPSASPEVQRCFRLNSKTGELILIMPLSYQNASLLPAQDNSNVNMNLNSRMDITTTTSTGSQMGHIIPIQVSDQIHITQMLLRVVLRKINMNPPTIHVASHLRLSSRGNQIWIAEDTQPGSLVAMINVIDADELIPQARTNQMLGNFYKSECRSKHELFDIVPLHTATNSDFRILLKKSLDRETKSSHTVKIECWDSGEPPLTAETSILIQVDDVNDSPPVFERQFYFAKIKEGLDASTTIIQVRATDADLGKNAEIVYRLVNQEYTPAIPLPESICSSMNTLHFDNNLIMINENTGELISQISLDRESISSINCTIEAINRNQLYVDNENQKSSEYKTSTQVIITIEDVNDCKPVFNESSYEFTVVEGQKSHHQIGRVHAIDCDAEVSNRMIRYSMRPSPGAGGNLVKLYVYISFEGIIYTHQTTDREQTPVLTFEVIATDTGNPPLSAVASVLIRILDTNDNAPVWIFPKQFGANSVINISQYSTVGLLIAQLKAIDLDEGLNGEVVYSIVHGNDDGLFEVDPMSGALYLVRSFHHLAQTLNLKSIPREEFNASGLLQTGESTELLGKLHEQIYSYRLLLKAQDRGTPPRHNTTVLYVAVLPSQIDKQPLTDRNPIESMYHHSDLKRQAELGLPDIRRMDRDLIVMVVLIALTLIISIILIMAIFLIRCKSLLCILPFRRSNHRTNHQQHPHQRINNASNINSSNNNTDNNLHLTLENNSVQSNNIRDQLWSKSWKGKTLPADYCINKSGDLLSTSCQDVYKAATLEHCPEFNLLRCVQNTASNSPCDHILLKDSTYRTIDTDTFKHSSSPQPCNSSSTFSTNNSTNNNNNNVSNNNTNNNSNNMNPNHKYNTISALHNPIGGGNAYIIEMNSQNRESPYTLLKATDLSGLNKEFIYQPLCSTSGLLHRQCCITPIMYEHEDNNNNNNNNQTGLCVVNTCSSTSPIKTNTLQRQVHLTNLNSPQLNERKRKMKTIH